MLSSFSAGIPLTRGDYDHVRVMDRGLFAFAKDVHILSPLDIRTSCNPCQINNMNIIEQSVEMASDLCKPADVE